MANRYGRITKSDQKNVDGGYKNVVLWAPRSSFLSVKQPDSTNTAPGKSLEIVQDHTFGVDDGFISWLCKKDSVTIKGTSEGEPGAKSMVWTSEFVLLGDSSSTQEQLEDMLNDDVILLLKDGNCLAATDYVQLGDDCNNPEFTIEFDGKTTAAGLKEYKVTMKSKKGKYFYKGTVTEKPVVEFYPLSALVANANPNKIVITFSKAVKTDIVPLFSQFALTGTSTNSISNAALVVAGNTITLTASAAFVAANTIKISYIKDAPFLQDVNTNAANTFVDFPVTNNVNP
jgi:hypothetical protein